MALLGELVDCITPPGVLDREANMLRIRTCLVLESISDFAQLRQLWKRSVVCRVCDYHDMDPVHENIERRVSRLSGEQHRWLH